MAAISFQINRGVDGFKISDFTVGTVAPGAGDAQFCFNTTDTNSVTITRKDCVQFLEAFKRAIESDSLFFTPVGL